MLKVLEGGKKERDKERLRSEMAGEGIVVDTRGVALTPEILERALIRMRTNGRPMEAIKKPKK